MDYGKSLKIWENFFVKSISNSTVIIFNGPIYMFNYMKTFLLLFFRNNPMIIPFEPKPYSSMGGFKWAITMG